MEDVKRAYVGLAARQCNIEPQATSRPSLEGMISVLTDKIEYANKQAEELSTSLVSILYPLPPIGVGVDNNNKKETQPILPQSIERLESLCRKLDKLNDELSSIQSRLCL